MRRIVHLSDLHFGRDRPELMRPLIETINRLAPDLVAISGDFTQRARLGQYRAARAFLSLIDVPWIAVPGNHDTPLDNLFVRLLTPWTRYRRYISEDLEPTWRDDEVTVIGINTVNTWAWQRGRIGQGTLRRVCDAVAGNVQAQTHVAMMHHPLEHAPGVDKRLMKGARRALGKLADCGVDVVLSGHLHTWHVDPFTDHQGVLFVQAGTGLSTRQRGEPNDFNLLVLDGTRAEIEQWTADALGSDFAPARRARFEKFADGWVRAVD
ncbi:MAG: metallophosphoesterase family protein [Jannaschia sp.]